ncbi:MAG TPA: WYL domain-containing protein [Kofleriaceae bacterium]|nr:WYL domain-containing protein [Kofleriaceae bacterium]
MRATRLLSIVMALQVRGRVNAETLASELGVSVRTIYRDLDDLGGAGIPVQSEAGPGGGYQLLDGYRTRLTGLLNQEAEALFLIGMPGPAAALGMGRAVVAAGRKVLASLPGPQGNEAARLSARFHLDPVEWYRHAEPVVHLPVVARAVLDQRALTMKYQSWTGVRDFTVEPLGLVLKAGAWYLVARGGRKVRIFKVSSMLELAATRRASVRSLAPMARASVRSDIGPVRCARIQRSARTSSSSPAASWVSAMYGACAGCSSSSR